MGLPLSCLGLALTKVGYSFRKSSSIGHFGILYFFIISVLVISLSRLSLSLQSSQTRILKLNDKKEALPVFRHRIHSKTLMLSAFFSSSLRFRRPLENILRKNDYYCKIVLFNQTWCSPITKLCDQSCIITFSFW